MSMGGHNKYCSVLYQKIVHYDHKDHGVWHFYADVPLSEGAGFLVTNWMEVECGVWSV